MHITGYPKSTKERTAPVEEEVGLGDSYGKEVLPLLKRLMNY